MIGQTVSHYKIVDKLGEGGMGVVYKAEDTKLKRTVALKFLPPELTREEDAKKRFVHEAQAASTLDHPNICTVYEIDETPDGRMFIAMAYYEGESLNRKIGRGPLKMNAVLDLAIQAASGIKKAHEQNIVHRDIKPANIVVTTDGVAKLVDFGLAKLGGRTKLTKEGTTLGTVAYMSPEQIRGSDVDERSDIWALGAVMYEMIAGRPPFAGDFDQAIMYSISSETPEPLTAIRTNVPMELERIVSKCLSKDPGERYQHADDLLVDLKLVKKQSDSSATPQPSYAGQRRSYSTSRRWIIVAAAVVAIAAVAYFLIKPILMEPRPVGEPTPIVVITFENQTGDASYDYLQEAIPNLLITSLERSPMLRVVTWERLHDLLKQMGKADAGVIDKETGFELCRLESIETIVVGSYVKAGDVFVTDVKVLEVSTMRLMKGVSASGDGVESILRSQIDELGKEIARSVGIAGRESPAVERPIAEVTTTSMEAYNYFLRGAEAWRQFNYDDSQEYLRKAISIDSTFAMAHLYLGFTFRLIKDSKSVKVHIKKAVALSGHAAEKERMIIDMYSARYLEDDPQKRLSILKQLLKRYPDDKYFHYDMGTYYHFQGQYPEAIDELKKAIALDPSYGTAVNQIAYSYANIGEFEEALEYARMYESIEPGKWGPAASLGELYFKKGDIDRSIASYQKALNIDPDLLGTSYRLAYLFALKEDYPGCLRYLDEHIKIAEHPHRSYGRRGFHRAWQGDYEGAIADLDRALEIYKAAGDNSSVAACERWKGWMFYDQGELEASRSAFERMSAAAQSDYSSALLYFACGLIDLKEGNLDSARRNLTDLASKTGEFEDETNLEDAQYWHRVLSAEVYLLEGDTGRAISSYRDLAHSAVYSHTMWDNYPFVRDVVARAHVANGDTANAIAEYERLTHFDPSNNNRSLIHPKYHYRLGILYEQTGKSLEAVREYEKFTGYWTPDVENDPLLADTKRRLKSLKKTVD